MFVLLCTHAVRKVELPSLVTKIVSRICKKRIQLSFQRHSNNLFAFQHILNFTFRIWQYFFMASSKTLRLKSALDMSSLAAKCTAHWSRIETSSTLTSIWALISGAVDYGRLLLPGKASRSSCRGFLPVMLCPWACWAHWDSKRMVLLATSAFFVMVLVLTKVTLETVWEDSAGELRKKFLTTCAESGETYANRGGWLESVKICLTSRHIAKMLLNSTEKRAAQISCGDWERRTHTAFRIFFQYCWIERCILEQRIPPNDPQFQEWKICLSASPRQS